MGLETLAFAAISLAVAGTAAYSSYQQGQAAKQQGKYNAQAQTINQKTTQQQADFETGQVREKYRRLRGAQVASAAASGLSSDGSFSDLVFDTNMQEDLTILSTLYQSKVQITGQEQKKTLSLMQGKQGQQAGNMAAAGSLLSAGGSFIGGYPTLS